VRESDRDRGLWRFGEVRDALYVVGGLAIVVFFIVRQLRSDRFEQRSLIFPIGLGIYGAVILNGTSKHHPVTAASAALLCLSAAASVGFGVIRGRTIELFERDGELWERATWATIAGWIGLLVTRILIIAAATSGFRCPRDVILHGHLRELSIVLLLCAFRILVVLAVLLVIIVLEHARHLSAHRGSDALLFVRVRFGVEVGVGEPFPIGHFVGRDPQPSPDVVVAPAF